MKLLQIATSTGTRPLADKIPVFLQNWIKATYSLKRQREAGFP